MNNTNINNTQTSIENVTPNDATKNIGEAMRTAACKSTTPASNYKKWQSTILYIVMVILINVGYSNLPTLTIFGAPFASGDLITGSIYIVRDFAQRSIGHRILYAMIVASFISYFLSDKSVAIASVAAFTCAESLDWLIFTLNRSSFSRRLLLSSLISTPVDSLVFLTCIQHFRWSDFILMTASKWLGVILVWIAWRLRSKQNNKSSRATRC